MPKNSAISYTGLDELIDRLKTSDTNTNIVLMSFFRGWSNDAVRMAQEEIDRVGAVDLGELRNGIHFELSYKPPESVIKPSTYADRYAAAVEYGTRPHWPPIEAIEGWALRHGISPFAVARGIAQKGTKPRHFWERTYERLDKQVGNDIPKLGDAIIRKAL